MNIPRNKIPWYPRINYDSCKGCLLCVNFCKNNVYSVNEGKPVVINPFNCVVGCKACSKLCPNNAISFPSRDEFITILKKLRENYK
jgi:NAD-dependent dihydropyrimidine dehydrogenase PreA subunit